MLAIVIAFFLGVQIGFLATSFFTAKAVNRARNEAENSERILCRMIHENNVLTDRAWKGDVKDAV